MLLHNIAIFNRSTTANLAQFKENRLNELNENERNFISYNTCIQYSIFLSQMKQTGNNFHFIENIIMLAATPTPYYSARSELDTASSNYVLPPEFVDKQNLNFYSNRIQNMELWRIRRDLVDLNKLDSYQTSSSTTNIYVAHSERAMYTYTDNNNIYCAFRRYDKSIDCGNDYDKLRYLTIERVHHTRP